jgi:hypothetical protein
MDNYKRMVFYVEKLIDGVVQDVNGAKLGERLGEEKSKNQ